MIEGEQSSYLCSTRHAALLPTQQSALNTTRSAAERNRISRSSRALILTC
jgi:hypothetical protein